MAIAMILSRGCLVIKATIAPKLNPIQGNIQLKYQDERREYYFMSIQWRAKVLNIYSRLFFVAILVGGAQFWNWSILWNGVSWHQPVPKLAPLPQGGPQKKIKKKITVFILSKVSYCWRLDINYQQVGKIFGKLWNLAVILLLTGNVIFYRAGLIFLSKMWKCKNN